ncbi:peptidase M14 [bacterium]|nr:peptidase M14 [bacterium]
MPTLSLQIDDQFPGGNIRIEKIEGDGVFLAPDPRDTDQFWFYWAFRVRGGAGRTVRFHFTKPNTLTTRGPAISLDEGWSWRWLGLDPQEPWGFTCEFPENAHEVFLSMGMPYTERHFQSFLKAHDDPRLSGEILCMSRKGRPVERLRVGNLNGSSRHRILLTARHHCCEMMTSYALEGLIDSFLNDDETGDWLRKNVELIAVPFVDKDGVEDGDQGKNRNPRDHNRDYDENGIYPETNAIRRMVEIGWEGRVDVALDLHCPYIRGGNWHEMIHIVGSSDPRNAAEQKVFARFLADSIRGPLPFQEKNLMAYGTSWNTKQNDTLGPSFCHWAASLPGCGLAATIEIPYANAEDREVNQSSARAFGHDLARALRQYLEERKEV